MVREMPAVYRNRCDPSTRFKANRVADDSREDAMAVLQHSTVRGSDSAGVAVATDSR